VIECRISKRRRRQPEQNKNKKEQHNDDSLLHRLLFLTLKPAITLFTQQRVDSTRDKAALSTL
jgi:hypothetical protein